MGKVEEDLEPGLALDPNSYAAKARKRKEPPTEADVLSSVRKRPATPPQEGARVGSSTSAVTTQGQVAVESSTEAARPPPERVTGAVSALSPQETTQGQLQPMEVSQGIQQTVVAVDGTPTTVTVTSAVTTTHSQGDTSGQRPVEESHPREQSLQGIESHSSQQQRSQETAQVSAAQSPAGQSNTQRMDHPDEPPQEEMSESDRCQQWKTEKLTRIMLESIYSNDIGIAPAAEIIHKAVLNFATFASQFDHLAMAQDKLPEYAGNCMSGCYEHYAQRALQGFEDDQEIVDAVCVAHDAMPTLLPAAFAACIEEEQKEALTRSIESERLRKEQAELEQRNADREELEGIQREIEEAERLHSRQVNAAQITQLMIGRMAELAEQSQAGEPGTDLTESLTRSWRSFFDQTTSEEAEYLTRSATKYVAQMRDAEFQRIRRATPETKAAMTLIKHAGKFITHLPTAIQQVLQVVQFSSQAPPTRDLDDHQAEQEEDAPPEEEPQGPPSSGTPPGPPPPWNPREASSTGRTGRVQETVQRFEAPPIVNVPTPKWHGWKTQTGPTIADVEQSRMSPFGEPESEMPDANLREAMIRSLQETRRDPYEPPNTGGASGSGAMAQHAPSPQQASTPNTQSEGEGSVIPKGQSRIAVTSLQLPSNQITSADLCLALEDRIKKQREGSQNLFKG